MKYYSNKVTDINIAYVGGGSRGWAWGLMSDLAGESEISGTVKLYDIDYQAAYDNEVIGNKVTARSDIKGKWAYKAVATLEEALTGADFVIISILPGTFDEMASDVHEPEKYGIYQSVGDSVGPGGIIRALRTIPMYVAIAENIKRFCPEAWVINYTNPMTLCVRTLYEVFPEIKAFGCCHEVFGTQKVLAGMLSELSGIEGADRNEIRVNVLGVNHFTWLDRANYRGIDLMPLYKEFVDRHYEEGYEENREVHWMNSTFASANRVKFDLFRRYGLLAAAGDRHLAEFVPGKWYLKDPETVKSWKFGLTTVDWRKENLLERLEKSRRLVSGRQEFEMNKTGEEGVSQIKAILGLQELVTNVNLPNRGQMPDVPLGSVVETNALFTRDSVIPVQAGKLPAPVQGLFIRQVYNQETTLRAGLTKDKDMALRAFANDALVCSIGLNDIKTLFNRMLTNTREYLPGWIL